ncbi:MAG: hypothetical protein ACRELB_14955, partial [Polyangiaceae bacterium]
MSYRDVSESLRAYRDRIASDLEEARRAAKEAADRADRVKVLENELTETDGLLAKMGTPRRGLPMLDDLRIAAPCPAKWEDMVGDDHVRFCGGCEKNVYNLSSLSRDEAEALLVAREGNLCARIYRRQDGTVLTEDCPVGVKKRRRRRATLAAVGGGLMAAAAALGAKETRATMGEPMPITMGSVAQVEPLPTAPTSTATTAPTGHWLGGAVALP